VLAYLNETGLSPEVLPLAPDGLAELVDLVADGGLSRNQAKDVLDECLREPKRHLAPEPPAAAGDERTLAVQPESIEDSHARRLLPARVAGLLDVGTVSSPRERSCGPTCTAASALGRRPPRPCLGYFGVTPMLVTRIVWSRRGRKPCTHRWTPYRSSRL